MRAMSYDERLQWPVPRTRASERAAGRPPLPGSNRTDRAVCAAMAARCQPEQLGRRKPQDSRIRMPPR